jgi:hypothetical protein
VAEFPLSAVVLIAVIIAAGLLSIAHVLANTFGNERRRHDLKVRVGVLRKQYTERIAAMRAREHGAEMVVAEVVSDHSESGQKAA